MEEKDMTQNEEQVPAENIENEVKETISELDQLKLDVEEQKQKLLDFLKRVRGTGDEGPRKITLTRKTVGTIKTGQGRTGRAVTVEVRRKRTYVKREDVEETGAEAAAADLKNGQTVNFADLTVPPVTLNPIFKDSGFTPLTVLLVSDSVPANVAIVPLVGSVTFVMPVVVIVVV